ncbi:DUF1573 domain-containing protein [Limibacter armeniacum]|uniref:DUF1573 domain-containing protein n=1 Tax=Limibacter armeniacum TaxID=466084 RepID=UPI002FE6591B
MRKFILPQLAALFSIITLLAVSVPVLAQSRIEFENDAHDFGKIQEEGGPAGVVFKFKNTGNQPLKLESVNASCGCTTPEWSKDAVLPGEEGYVKASYNPRNRPGVFHKSITVRTNGQPEVKVLKISGEVIPRPQGPEDFYPMESGNVRFKTSHIVMGSVLNDQKETGSTILYNQGKSPIEINLNETETPAHIKTWASKTTLAPADTATLFVEYDASQKKDWGYVFEYFMLKTNDTEQPDKRINLSAHIKENFEEAQTSGQLPKVVFEETEHNFGDLKPGEKVTTAFKVTNNGNAPLLIRKTKASCGCTATKPEKTELQPGEETSINVTYTAVTYQGEQRKSITVICNDPENAETTLWIKANITSEGK